MPLEPEDTGAALEPDELEEPDDLDEDEPLLEAAGAV